MAQLVGKGRIALANDDVTEGLLRNPTKTRQALVEIAGPLVSQVLENPDVTTVVSSTVNALAPAAFNNAAAALNADITAKARRNALVLALTFGA